MLGLNEDKSRREDAAARRWDCKDKSLHNQLEQIMGMEYATSSPASIRISLLGEDALRSGGVLTRILEWKRASRTGLGQRDILQVCVIVGEAESIEHRSAVEHISEWAIELGQSMRATSRTMVVEQCVESVPHCPAKARIRVCCIGSMASKTSSACRTCLACFIKLH